MCNKVSQMVPLAIAVALMASACVPRVRENNIIIPRKAPAMDTAQLSVAADWTLSPLRLVRPGGAVLSGAYFKRPDAKATVIYFGGNGFVLSKMYTWLTKAYAGLPVDIVVFDHRGYGGSTGSGGFEAMYQDATAIYDDTRARVKGPILVHGHSLGSFIAGQVAAQRPLDGLILESTATNALDWAHSFKAVPRPILRLFIEPNLRSQGNDRAVLLLDEPTVFVTGQDDTTTRPSMATSLYKAASLPPERKQLVIVPGKGHANATDSAEFKAAVEWLLGRGG